MSMVVRSQLLATAGGVIQGVSTSEIGNLSYLYGPAGEVTKSRGVFLRQLGTEAAHGVCYRPLNWDVIVEIDESYRGIGMGQTLPLRADAVVTRSANVGLMLLLADCLGIVMYDPRQRVVAMAHCGVRSTNARLAAQLVRYLASAHGSLPEELLVYLTPAIAAENYLYDEGIRTFTQGWSSYIRPARDGQYQVDLLGYNLEQLHLAGIRTKNIESAGVDTFSSERFYSHVRSVRQGQPKERFGVYVEMQPSRE